MNSTATLFDFQVNGFAGVDYQKENMSLKDLRFSVEKLKAHGAKAIFLTLVTNTVDCLCRQFSLVERLRSEDPLIAEVVCGYHLEGPWLRPEVGYCGAHPMEPMCAPTIPAFERLQRAAGGRIRLVTLAPEWPGSADFIAAIVSQGVHVALGHTNAGNDDITAAIRAGARFCTHLGNGVPGMLPRHDNVVQRLLARDELIACFIPDGIHLPPFVLQNLFRAKPPGRALLTTDAMAAAGAPPGRYSIGGRSWIEVGADRVVRDPGVTGGFAGSALEPDRGVELTAQFLGISREEATRLWSEAPAREMGFPT